MNFTFPINIPAGTPESNPLKYEMKLSAGIVYDFELIFSSACNGEVYCYITDIYGNKVFPRNPDGIYQLWSPPIRGRYPSCKYRLTGQDMNLIFVGYSPGASYDHIITVSWWIVSEDDIPILQQTAKEISGLKNFIEGIRNERL